MADRMTPVSRHEAEMTATRQKQKIAWNETIPPEIPPKTLSELRDMLQGDLECILDGLEDRILINAQQAVVDRVKQLEAFLTTRQKSQFTDPETGKPV